MESSQETPTRTAFFISDSTGITAETLGHSLLAQFEGLKLRQVRMPFVDSREKVQECVERIAQAARDDGVRPIVFSTLVQHDLNLILCSTDGKRSTNHRLSRLSVRPLNWAPADSKAVAPRPHRRILSLASPVIRVVARHKAPSHWPWLFVPANR